MSLVDNISVNNKTSVISVAKESSKQYKSKYSNMNQKFLIISNSHKAIFNSKIRNEYSEAKAKTNINKTYTKIYIC